MKHRASILIFLIFISGCTIFVEFEDVSSNEEFSSILNRTFSTKEKLLIHGVNMDATIGKKVHLYDITPFPGMGGREILNREVLPIGTDIKLIEILRCTNCYLDFSPRIKYVVNILPAGKYSGKKIQMGGSFANIELVLLNNGKYTLNPDYFASNNK